MGGHGNEFWLNKLQEENFELSKNGISMVNNHHHVDGRAAIFVRANG